MTAPLFYSILDVLYQDRGVSFYRARRSTDGRPVLLKVLEPRQADAAALEHLKRDVEFSTELFGQNAAVLAPQALDHFEGRPAAIFDDVTGNLLETWIGRPMEIGRFLDFALWMVTALAEIHRRNIVHRNLKPENFLLSPEEGEARLLDFGLAIRIPGRQQVVGAAPLIEGSLPYIAPETTGKTNRAIDARADLYSLGVVFFQMLTGALPFHAQDPLEWVHCHVAREPANPSTLRTEIPEIISQIVLKLLSKLPEDRYQSAQGLKRDLQRCREAWLAGRKIAPFVPGEDDESGRLRISQKLYGREREMEQLVHVFDRMVEAGAPRIALVSGDSGVGKTALVRELYMPIARKRGFFIAGKFDRFKRDTPYSTLVQAFRDLVFEILSESGEGVSRWRERLRSALGANGKLIADVIPQIELLIGPQPSIPELSPAEAQNRFHLVFRQFIGVFTRKEHPLTLFLDDLQWADFASLALLKDLLTHPETGPLLVVGARRTGEESSNAVSTSWLDGLREQGAEISEISLVPLSPGDLAVLVSDTLHASIGLVRELSDLIHEKTAGNPFFAVQFLTILYEERLIEFDSGERRWRWDLPKIRALSYTDNVPGLMIEKLKRLPPETREVLKLAACLGNTAGLDLLAAGYGKTEERTSADLQDALRGGVVILIDRAYKFLHDRLQEAAYSLIPPASRAEAHLALGRALLRNLPSPDPYVFEIAGQLNRGVALIDDPSEREALSRLNFKAGKKAKASIAYSSASRYLNQAMSLLSPDAWTNRYEETLQLYLETAECEHLSGNFEHADSLFRQATERTESRVDRMKIYILRLRLYQIVGRYREGLALIGEAAELYEIAIPESDEDLAASVQNELREVPKHLGGRRILDLVDAPVAEDPDIRVIIGLLSVATPYAYIAKPTLFPLLALKTLNFSLKFGNTEASCFTYNAYGTMLISLFGEIRSGFEFSLLALRLNEKFRDARLRGTLLFLHAHCVTFWVMPLSANRALLDQVLPACLEVGDLVYAGYHAALTVWQAIERGDSLAEVLRLSSGFARFSKQIHSVIALKTIQVQQKSVAELKGWSPEQTVFEGEQFDEEECLRFFEQGAFTSLVSVCVLKQLYHFVSGRYEEALKAAERARPWIGAVMAMMSEATFHFFHALTLTALFSGFSDERKAEARKSIEEALAKLKLWAENCPENFSNRYALVSAELARIEGRDLEAERLYEQAIRSARENGFSQNEGIACELASEFYRARGFGVIADAYLREAHSAFRRWGADGKVAALERAYPKVFERAEAPSTMVAFSTKQLDLLSVTKASQRISEEIVPESLICELLRVGLEQSGAQKGCLILTRPGEGDELSVDARAVVEESEIRAEILDPKPEEIGSMVPVSMIRWVRRARERVILNDAVADAAQFHADPYFGANRPRSALALPILRRSELIGVLYLENRAIPFAFSPDRLTALELLASQAAISLDIANLYKDLQHENAERKRAQEDLHRSLRARDDFIMVASHELRTPLTPLKLSMQLLERVVRKVPSENIPHFEEVLQSFSRTGSQLDRLTQLVENLLDISQITAGRLVLYREQVDLGQLVREFTERNESKIRSAGCILEMRLAPGVRGRWDRGRIEQVFSSIFANALKYGARKPIEVEVSQEDGRALLIVVDHGIGIPREAQDRIFERFEREESITHYEGLGLGLYISREIVYAHGGNIRVKSAPSRGATFVIELPL